MAQDLGSFFGSCTDVAAGSAHTGMWHLFRGRAYGISASMNRYRNIAAPSTLPMAEHRGNVVHSCAFAGLFLEPTNHDFARDNDGVSMDKKVPSQLSILSLLRTVFEHRTGALPRLPTHWSRRRRGYDHI